MSQSNSIGGESGSRMAPVGSGLDKGTEDVPDWVKGLQEYFDYVGKKKRSVKKDGKLCDRFTYTLTCRLCSQGRTKPKSSQKKRRGEGPEVSGNGRYNFTRHLERMHSDISVPKPTSTKRPRSETSGSESEVESADAPEGGPKKTKPVSIVLSGINVAESIAKRDSSLLPKYDPKGEKQTIFNELLLNMVVKTGVPFNLVEKESFATLVSYLDSRLQIPSRRSISRLLATKNNSIVGHLKAALKGLPPGCLHLILDIWSSKQQISVIGVQVRFVDDWKIRQCVVGFSEFPGGHTAENIRKKVEKILGAYGLSMADVFTVTADSAASMISAFKHSFPRDPHLTSGSREGDPSQAIQGTEGTDEIVIIDPNTDAQDSADWIDMDSDEDELLDVDDLEIANQITVEPEVNAAVDDVVSQWVAQANNRVFVRRNSCLAHLLQLGIRSALKNKPVDSLLKKVSEMISWFSKSNKELSLLKDRTNIGFVKPNETRWNSTFMCLERLFTEVEVIDSSVEGDLVTVKKELFICVANSVYAERKNAKRKERITDEEVGQLKTILHLLKPLADLTNTWQADGITSSTVITGLIEALKALDLVGTEEDEELASFKNQLKSLVVERFDTNPEQKAWSLEEKDTNIVTLDVFNDKYFILATLLDPRNKTIPFEDDFDIGTKFRNGHPTKSQVITMLKEAFESEKLLQESSKEIHEIVSDTDSSELTTTTASQPIISSEARQDSRKSSSQPGTNKATKLNIFSSIESYRRSKFSSNQNDEVKSYLAENPADNDTQPLRYWKNRKDTYPILSTSVQRVLTI